MDLKANKTLKERHIFLSRKEVSPCLLLLFQVVFDSL